MKNKTIICGPQGSGKNFLSSIICDSGKFKKVLTVDASSNESLNNILQEIVEGLEVDLVVFDQCIDISIIKDIDRIIFFKNITNRIFITQDTGFIIPEGFGVIEFKL